MDGITIALFFIVGCLTGFLSGFLGVGGGFILVPLLIFIGVPTYVAIGSSLAYMVFTALSGAVQHYRQRSFDLKLALLVSCGGVVTAQIGAVMTLYIEARYLEILLGLILLVAGIRMVIQKDVEAKKNNVKGHWHHRILAPIAIGLLTGFISGLLGVGGGFLLVPLLTLMLHVPIHIAIGTSLMSLVGSAVSGAIRHWMIGHVDLLTVGILTVGGSLSAPLGAKTSKKLSQQLLRKAFSIVLFLFAFKLLVPT
jgi:uncharacterized membrane protein YfcA